MRRQPRLKSHYEGYAPGGGGRDRLEAATDNKNVPAGPKSAAIFTKNHTAILDRAEAFPNMFHRKGQIIVPRSSIDEERIFELALEAGGGGS